MRPAGGGGRLRWRRAIAAGATLVAALWPAPGGAAAAGGAAGAGEGEVGGDAGAAGSEGSESSEVAVDIIDLPPLPAMDEDVAKTTALLAAASVGEDLVTGAAKREQSLGNVASAVTVISGDRLRRMGARTVGEAIATAAGIHLVDDRLSTRVGIRGLQLAGDFNTRILVVIDGTSVTESWSHLSGVGYDLPLSIDEIERVEVIRGPVSSIYGTNAFFGIINIITRGPNENSRAWARATAATIGGGSVAAGFALGSLDKQLRGSISATMRRGEVLDYDYGGDTPVHQVRSMDAGEQLQLSLAGAYHGTFAQLRAYRYDRTIPFAPYESNFDDPYHQTNQQLLVDVGHALEWYGVQLSGRLFGNFYQFDDLASDAIDEDAPALGVIGTARTIGAEVRGRYQPLEQLGVTAGVEASYNDTNSDYFSDDDNVRNEAGDLAFGLGGFYVEADSAPTPWLGLTAGVRVDAHTELATGVSPRLAAFLSRSEHYGLKLLYAEGFRYPSTYEALFNDQEDVVGYDDISELDPEQIRSMEAVAWARPTATTWLRASLFNWEATKIIKQAVTEVMPGKEALRFDNGDAYSSYGLELEASYRDRRGWLAFAGATLAKVRLEQTLVDPAGAELEDPVRPPGSPWFTASFGVSSPRLGDLVHVSSELNVIGAQPTQLGARTEPFVGWNAAVYVPAWRGFDLTIGARNLLGVAQEVPAAEDFDREEALASMVPGEGRELYVRLGHALP